MLFVSTLFALTKLEQLQAAVKDAGVHSELKETSVDAVIDFAESMETDSNVLKNEMSNPLFAEIKAAMLNPDGFSKLPRSCSAISSSNICSVPNLRKRGLDEQDFTGIELRKIPVSDNEPDIERPAVDDPQLAQVATPKVKSKGVRNNGGGCTAAVFVIGIVVLLGSIAGIVVGSLKIEKQQQVVDAGNTDLYSHCDWQYTCKPGVNLPEYRTVVYYELVSHCYLPQNCYTNSQGYRSCSGGGPGCYWQEQRSRQDRINYLDRVTGEVNLAEVLDEEIALGLCEKYNNGDTDDVATCKRYASGVGQSRKKRDIHWAYLAPSILGVIVGLGMVIGGGCSLFS